MRICILGTGYVGLVSAACFAEMGNAVTCVDTNPTVVRNLEQGRIHIYEPGLAELVRRNSADGRLRFTDAAAKGLNGADLAFITVGTPQGADGAADLSAIEAASRAIGREMTGPLVVANKSTAPVGTVERIGGWTREELRKRGADWPVRLASNPEFLKEGDAVNDFMKPDRIIAGADNPEAEAMLRQAYAPFARSREKFMAMSVRSAEMTKYAANCMLATKISFINEIAGLCEALDADVNQVRAGIAADERIGRHFIYPGAGYGGSCFPKDVQALIASAAGLGRRARILEAVEAVNADQKLLMARKIEDYFAAQGGVAGRTLGLWGLAFKANTDDMRMAPSLETIAALTGRGMRVRAFDPAAMDRARELLKENPLVEFAPDQYAALENADAWLVLTEWNQFRDPDFARIRKLMRAPVLFDGRNLYARAPIQEFAYFGVGVAPRTPEPKS